MIVGGYDKQLNIRNGSLSGTDQNLHNNTAPETGDGKGALSGLSGGDTLSGKIVSKDGNEVNISLGGGNEITARLDVAAELPVGSTVAFTVLSSDRSGVVLSPLLTNTDMSSPVNTALLNAGFELDSRNIQMVKSMMEYGMPIGRDELMGMSNMLKDVPSSEINNAIILTHMGIEPTPENLASFDSYLNYEHQINGAVNEIIDLMPDAISELATSSSFGEAVNMTSDMLEIFTDQGTYLYMTSEELSLSGMETPVSQILNPSELNEFAELLVQNGMDEAFAESMVNGEVSLRDILFVVNDLIKGMRTDGETAPDMNGMNGQGTVSPDAADITASGKDMVSGSGTPGLEDIPLTAGSRQDPSMVDNNHTPKEGSGSVGLDFLNSLKGDEIKGETLESAVHAAERFNKEQTQNNILRLLTSKPLNNLLKEAVNNEWKLTPRQVGEDKQVEDLYKRITEQTNRLLNALSEHTDKQSALSESLTELGKNVNFMNELNQMFNYVQLPLKLSGNDAHGELYVYSNKKHMASNDGTVSALLHLDMDHLGATDVYVTMNSANHVNTHFYLPDDEALDLIAAHIDELNARIESRGYTCSAAIDKRDKMANMMEEMVAEDKPAVTVSVSNFDARA